MFSQQSQIHNVCQIATGFSNGFYQVDQDPGSRGRTEQHRGIHFGISSKLAPNISRPPACRIPKQFISFDSFWLLLFQIVLAGKSLIFQTKMDITRANSSEQMRDLHQIDQQDETRPMVLKINPKMDFNLLVILIIFNVVGYFLIICVQKLKHD